MVCCTSRCGYARNEDGVMTNASGEKQTHSASKAIKVSPGTIYQALLNPEAVAAWRPPAA
jgi:hypothetical protein